MTNMISLAVTCLLAKWQASVRRHDFYLGYRRNWEPVLRCKAKCTIAQTRGRIVMLGIRGGLIRSSEEVSVMEME